MRALTLVVLPLICFNLSQLRNLLTTPIFTLSSLLITIRNVQFPTLPAFVVLFRILEA